VTAPHSPFASQSWEPRFVVEHYNEAALHSAIELWASMWHIGFATLDSTVRHVTMRPDCLLVEHPNARDHAGEPLPEPVALRELTPWIMAWLHTATYPDQPWFDGGEQKGFCVFWAHYQCAESGAYGSLVVIPKWFELHK
jgi:hypothetical protein